MARPPLVDDVYTCSTAAGNLGVSDQAAAGRHVVTTSAGARFRLEVVGRGAATLEHRSA